MTIVGVFAALLAAASAGEHRRTPFSLEETYQCRFAKFKPRWMTDTAIEFRNETTGHVMSYDVAEKETSVLLESSVLDKFGSDSYQFSSDGKYVLISYENNTEVDRSQSWLPLSRYVVYSLQDKTFADIDGKSFIQHAEWVPGHSAIIYVKNNNIYRVEISRKLVAYALTFNGIPGVIFNGVCDLLYKEEVIHRSQTLSLSPDGTQMIYLSIDASEVGVMTLPWYGVPGNMENQYPKNTQFSFSKPGTPIPKFIVWHLNFTDDTQRPVAQSVEGKEIIYDTQWVSDNLIQLVFMNRVQNVSVVELCYLNSLREEYPCRKVSEDRNEKGWAKGDTLLFSKDGDRYLTRNRVKVGDSEYYHLLVVYKNGSNVDLTPGSVTATGACYWDEKRRIVYYKSPKPNQPSTDHVFAVHESRREKPYCITCRLRIPENVSCKAGDVIFNPEFTHFYGICTGPVPRLGAIYENVRPVGYPVALVDASLDTRKWLQQRLQPSVVNVKVPVSDSEEAEVRLILPPSVETSGGKKYPLIIYVYGGPGSYRILDVFKVDWSLYLTTNRSIIYGIIDGRGSGRKGTSMMYAVYRALGTVEIEDQIAVTEHIANSFGFIDKNRIGIWGWSYGGYATAKILEDDVNGVFKCGVSVAPVSDWMYYNSFYTERYMDLPSANPEGYRKASTLYNVENLRDKQYLLIHGTGDDNVHYQHSMHLARVLQENNIIFEQETYPDERHGIESLRLHLFYTMDRFWDKCFGLSVRDD